jgi:hypothetical protein
MLGKKYYIGVKMVEAWPEERDGKPGYAVRYPDGYLSWSPLAVFEKAFDGNRFRYEIDAKQLDEKTTLVKCVMQTGFVQYESSSCVDPKNYDHEIGTLCGLKRIEDSIWKLLGFTLQWAKDGLKGEWR